MKISAYAKINLSLEVLGKRDDGYHDIATIMQTVDLADELEIEYDENGLSVHCSIPELSGRTNLVWKAAEALAEAEGGSPNVHINITKHIPLAMGLGGGSSDAAAALVGLNHFWGRRLSTEDLRAVAATVGSDVPFFIQGGTALCTGRGEKVESFQGEWNSRVLLICPKATIEDKTATMYSLLDRTCFSSGNYPQGDYTYRMAQLIREWLRVESAMLNNVFDIVAFAEFPGLQVLIAKVEANLRRRAHLTGTGPGLFCMNVDESLYRCR